MTSRYLRYHRDAFGLPSFVRTALAAPLAGFRLTRHALERAVQKNIDLHRAGVAQLDASWQVFEVEADAALRRVTKVVARRPLGDGRDVVAVFALDSRAVVTLWPNRSTDRHATLDRSLYARP